MQSGNDAFVIGDGKPIQSDGRCIIFVEFNHQAKGSELVQQSPTTFRWTLSAGSAGHCADLLSGMSNSGSPCHQYLDPDKAPPAPFVIVSFQEDEADPFRGAKV